MVRCRNAPELTYQTLQAEGQAQLGISRSGSVDVDLAGCRPQGGCCWVRSAASPPSAWLQSGIWPL
jgi:hypothetical protein